MDQITRKRHIHNPDFRLSIHATGVKLPDGRISWRLDNSNSTSPDKLTQMWWAELFADWAKSFLNRGLQNKN